MIHIIVNSPPTKRKGVVVFTPSVRDVVTAGKRAAAIIAGTAIKIAEALEATPEEMLGVPKPAIRYHMIVADDFDYVGAGAVYVAQWDGKTPYIKVLVGNQHAITHAFAGWPMVTQAEWEAANPVVLK